MFKDDWLYYCFTALRLRSFRARQLAYPHCSWASLLGSLPVLSAHSFASNWQLPFLNQRKGENGRRIFFITKSPRKNVPGVRIEPATVCLPGRTRIRPSKRARPQRHLRAWNKWGLSPQKHLQISFQVNLRL